jgi:hypothetical protein
MSGQPFAWPHGKRIAVTVTVMLETWSEGVAPPYGVQATPLKPGTIDHGGIAWGSYGGKVGVWRIIELMRRNKMRGGEKLSNDGGRRLRLNGGQVSVTDGPYTCPGQNGGFLGAAHAPFLFWDGRKGS